MKARQFNAEDWEGFAGAEPWEEDGVQPLIRELTTAIATADRNGIQILFAGPDYNYTYDYNLNIHPTPDMARLILNALPNNITVDQALGLGFIE